MPRLSPTCMLLFRQVAKPCQSYGAQSRRISRKCQKPRERLEGDLALIQKQGNHSCWPFQRISKDSMMKPSSTFCIWESKKDSIFLLDNQELMLEIEMLANNLQTKVSIFHFFLVSLMAFNMTQRSPDSVSTIWNHPSLPWTISYNFGGLFFCQRKRQKLFLPFKTSLLCCQLCTETAKCKFSPKLFKEFFPGRVLLA